MNPEKEYLLIRVFEGESGYNMGVFDRIPADLHIDLIPGHDYTFYTKVMKRGTGYGILYQEGNPPYFSSAEYWLITNSFTSEGMNNSVLLNNNHSMLYNVPDSSGIASYIYPEEDTYYNKMVFNPGSDSHMPIEINLDRMVFGLKLLDPCMGEDSISIHLENNIGSFWFTEDNVNKVKIISFSFNDLQNPVTESEDIVTTVKQYHRDCCGHSEVSILLDSVLTYHRLKAKVFHINPETSEHLSYPIHINLNDEEITDGDTLDLGY